MKNLLGTFALCTVVFLACQNASALPRFASRIGARCESCHENPSGAAMRREYGVAYGRETLPVPTWSDELGIDNFSPKLSDVVSIGADFRTLFFYIQMPDTGNPSRSQAAQNAFWQMEGNLYVDLRVAKRVTMYLKKTLYEDASGGFEIFGLFNLLPANGYVKVGRIVPNFGIKMENHRTYIREKTGFSPELGRIEHTGLEAAIQPGPLTIMGGLYNAVDGYGAGTGSDKAYLARAEGMFKLAENVNLGLGGNAFSRRVAGLLTTIYGGFGSFSYQNMTVFGEADLIHGNTAAGVNGFVTYVEGDYVVTQGLDLKLSYDFYDPDTELKTGSFARYGIGFEFFPISGVEITPLYRFVRESPVEVKNDEFELLLHLYW